MNMQELQDRANIIVQRVNNYEAALEKEQGNETELLSEHKYCDIHCLRAVYDWITGCDSTRKINTTLNSTVNGRLYSIDPDMNVTSNSYSRYMYDVRYTTNNLNTSGHTYLQSSSGNDITTFQQQPNVLSTDDITGMYNLNFYNTNYSNSSGANNAITNSSYSIGWLNSFGANIGDVLVTESQVVNLTDVDFFRINPEKPIWKVINDWRILNNSSTYNAFTGLWLLSNQNNSSTGSNIFLTTYTWNNNSVNVGYGTIFGKLQRRAQTNCDLEPNINVGNNFQLKAIIPGGFYTNTDGLNTYFLYPFTTHYGQTGTCTGYSREFNTNDYPAQQTYFELAFKRRRAGCKAAGLDFVPTLETIMDNDPQGLATRFALAQCKPYYRGRPWWTELDELYTENGEYQAKLADAILEASESMNDLEYLQNYKLNYETVANVMEWPL